MWIPDSAAALVRIQAELGQLRPEPWRPPDRPLAAAGCFVAFPRGIAGPGERGDRACAAVAVIRNGELVEEAVVWGRAGAAYEPGLLFMRAGPLLVSAVEALRQVPDLVLVNATGRDHPRRAGLALHLGAMLDLPTAGVTHRPLVATGDWPPDEPGATSPLAIGDEEVGRWLRARRGARPLAVHAAWRTGPATAASIVRDATRRARTPEPIRQARRLARAARAAGPPASP